MDGDDLCWEVIIKDFSKKCLLVRNEQLIDSSLFK